MALITSDYFAMNMTTLGLKSSFTPSAESLDQLIKEASAWAEGYCRRVLENREILEVIRGNDRRRIMLDNYPVTEVTSITWYDDSDTTGTDDLNLIRVDSCGILEWKNPLHGPFRSDRTYSITHKAGYTTVPDDLKRAVALKVADLMSPQYQGPQIQRVEMVTAIQTQLVELIEPYRRERLA